MEEYRKMPYDVLVVTGNYEMRQAEEKTLPGSFGVPAERMCFVGTLDDAVQTIDNEAKAGSRVGVVVTDMSLGGVTIGIQILGYVKSKELGIPVIIKSAGKEEDYARALIRKGAFAYYDKNKPLEGLVGKVREALTQPKN